MREYKFRGKRIDNGEWVYGGYFEQKNINVDSKVYFKHYILVNTAKAFDFNWMIEVDPKTVGQYTGLKDRNGKGREIYEGDVYKQDKRYYVVEWYETKCAYYVRSLTSGAVLPGHLTGEVAVYDDYEYVGSIHEHPHLLEQGEKE